MQPTILIRSTRFYCAPVESVHQSERVKRQACKLLFSKVRLFFAVKQNLFLLNRNKKNCYALIPGLLLLFGAFLAFETRKVTVPALNDSKFIGNHDLLKSFKCTVGIARVFKHIN